jgi:hypothetical protein
MIEIKIVKKYESGLRVEGLYSHKGKLGTVVDSTEAFTTLKWDGSKKVSTVQSHKIRPTKLARRQNVDIADAETALDTPKPASAYVDIPNWLEAEIVAMCDADADNTAHLASDLALALVYGEWDAKLTSCVQFSEHAYDWLCLQNIDVFRPLLQWVAMELI